MTCASGSRLRGIWESPGTGRNGKFKEAGSRPVVVPDALVALQPGSRPIWLAVEVDCGTENAQYVARKLLTYQGFHQTPLPMPTAVSVWVPGWRRMRSVIKACFRAGVDEVGSQCWLIDLERLQSMNSESQDVVDLASLGDERLPPTRSLAELLGSPVSVSRREDEQTAVSYSHRGSCLPSHVPGYTGSARGAGR